MQTFDKEFFFRILYEVQRYDLPLSDDFWNSK